MYVYVPHQCLVPPDCWMPWNWSHRWCELQVCAGSSRRSKYSYPMSYLSRWWCTPLPKTISPQHFYTSSFKTEFLYNPGFSGTWSVDWADLELRPAFLCHPPSAGIRSAPYHHLLRRPPPPLPASALFKAGPHYSSGWPGT